jgi:hypothetical protein
MGFMTWDDRLEAEEIPHYLTERDPVPAGPPGAIVARPAVNCLPRLGRFGKRALSLVEERQKMPGPNKVCLSLLAAAAHRRLHEPLRLVAHSVSQSWERRWGCGIAVARRAPFYLRRQRESLEIAMV